MPKQQRKNRFSKFSRLFGSNTRPRKTKENWHERSLELEQLETRRLLAINPTADEQEFMQLVNRFRTDPRGEFSRLISNASPITARDPDLQTDLDFAQVNGNTLRTELNTLQPTHPVAWNEAISNFNNSHNSDMIARGVHYHSNTTARRNELIQNGVNFRFASGEKINSEIVFGYAKSVNHLFASYVIDWQRGGPQGMVSGRGHRVAVHNPDFEQAGTAIRNYSGTTGTPPLGPKVSSSILANIEDPPLFVTGAIFEDKNDSTWYEAGEGLGGVKFVFTDQNGQTTEATSFGSGGYQIELEPGTYSATATGGGLRYTQRMSNIVVDDVNVWKNWIYDPEVIPPDTLESNNSTGAATQLTGEQQSFSGLNIHNSSDTDYFKLTSRGSGAGTFSIQFSNSAGNLDLQLLNSSGSVIASSTSTGNSESITHGLSVDTVYYVKVIGSGGATNGNYSLTVNPPDPSPPIASADRATFTGASATIVFDALSNDSNPDGSHSELTPSWVAGTHSAFKFNAQKQVEYTAPDGFSGVHRASYTLTNADDLSSMPAVVSIFVMDFNNEKPWQNDANEFDVNDDDNVTAIDALLAINEINNGVNGQLPGDASSASGIFGFVDASGDGFLTPLDALMIINRINSGGSGEFNSANASYGFFDENPDQLAPPLESFAPAPDYGLADDFFLDLARNRRKLLASS